MPDEARSRNEITCPFYILRNKRKNKTKSSRSNCESGARQQNKSATSSESLALKTERKGTFVKAIQEGREYLWCLSYFENARNTNGLRNRAGKKTNRRTPD